MFGICQALGKKFCGRAGFGLSNFFLVVVLTVLFVVVVKAFSSFVMVKFALFETTQNCQKTRKRRGLKKKKRLTCNC